jgi:hypothetical protein
MANSTYIKIATLSVAGSTQASLDFTSIPQTYEHLVLKINARSNRTPYNDDGMAITVNGATTNYDWIFLSANSSVFDNQTNSYEEQWCGRLSMTAQTTGIFNNAEITFTNYTSSLSKNYSSFSVTPSNNDNTEQQVTMLAARLTTTSPITTISISSATANSLIQNSNATLYGLKKA